MNTVATLNLIELAEKDLSQWKDFADIYCGIGYYRILFPGTSLAKYINDFMMFADNSTNLVNREKAETLLVKYAALYKRITTFPFDVTAPIKEGSTNDYHKSILHLKRNEVIDNIL